MLVIISKKNSSEKLIANKNKHLYKQKIYAMSFMRFCDDEKTRRREWLSLLKKTEKYLSAGD